MRVEQVDLDALGWTINNMKMANLVLGAERVEAAIAELRELRELVGCATEFRIGRCKVVSLGPLVNKWQVDTPRGAIVRLTLAEALAAAREWEGKNA